MSITFRIVGHAETLTTNNSAGMTDAIFQSLSGRRMPRFISIQIGIHASHGMAWGDLCLPLRGAWHSIEIASLIRNRSALWEAMQLAYERWETQQRLVEAFAGEVAKPGPLRSVGAQQPVPASRHMDFIDRN